MVIVYQSVGTPTAGDCLFASDNTGGNDTFNLFHTAAGGPLEIHYKSSNGTLGTIQAESAGGNTSPSIITLNSDGVDYMETFHNGVFVASANVASGFIGWIKAYRLGIDDAGDGPKNMYFAELRLYNAVLTNAQRSYYENYLMWKWGI